MSIHWIDAWAGSGQVYDGSTHILGSKESFGINEIDGETHSESEEGGSQKEDDCKGHRAVPVRGRPKTRRRISSAEWTSIRNEPATMQPTGIQTGVLRSIRRSPELQTY